MSQIRYGLEEGLTIEQVKFYADSKFDYKQMSQIKYIFERGLLTIEEVKEKYKLASKNNKLNRIAKKLK